MSRSYEVQHAIACVQSNMALDSNEARVLAAEIERLEAALRTVTNASIEQIEMARCRTVVTEQRAETAEARVKELEIVRDALIRSEESAQQLEELVSNQAQEYIERAEAAEQRAEESERAFGLLDEAHKSTTEKFASMMARVAELERELADLRNAGGPPFIRSEAIRNLKADLDAEKQEAATLRAYIAQDHAIVEMLEAQNARLREALTWAITQLDWEDSEEERKGGECFHRDSSGYAYAQAALADTKGTPTTADQIMREHADHAFERHQRETKGTQ